VSAISTSDDIDVGRDVIAKCDTIRPMYEHARVFVAALLSGLALSCTDDLISSDDGPSTSGSDTGDSGDGDGDSGDGDGDGDCELGTQGCACEPNQICDAGLSCVNDECVPVTCGDGMMDPGEACDDGNDDNTDTCLNNCELASCGDGYVEEGVEECDDGNEINTDTCLHSCVPASCGDGYVGPGESCDDGNLTNDDVCTNACAPPSCGDGLVQMGEECDDGNGDNGDACLSSCASASCGDGFVQQNVEECDDANADNTDDCTDSCDLPSCGDGHVHANVEECDDGNMLDTDACVDSCVPASCGDGFAQEGVEDCDDGNMLDTDACLVDCDAASCGDGFVQQNVEECDDANMVPDDGCDACNAITELTLTRGGGHTCLMLPDGTIRCWGENTHGQLGIGSTLHQGDGPGEMPPATIDVGGVPVWLASTSNTNYALLGDGSLRSWGSGTYGQTGQGNTDRIGDQPGEMPPAATNVGGPIAQIVPGAGHVCALLVNGQVRCWGYNVWGQCGVGHNDNIGDAPNEMPPAAANVGGNVVQLAVGGYHNCVLLDTNKVRCFGFNWNGALGYGHADNVGDEMGEMPPPDVNLGAGVIIQIGAAGQSNCALFQTGELRCWGWNASGQLGIGSVSTIGDSGGEMPPANTNYGAGVIAELHGGYEFYQLLMADGSVRNWGKGAALGIGTTSNFGIAPGEMPPNAVQLDDSVIAVSRGVGWESEHTCVMLQDMTVRCWGINSFGQLGYGNAIYIGDDPGEMPPAAVQAF
jgi:cysteine-rich repeat protein